ncbi:membrane dipeptidase [Streptomyces sp. A5-4]|uniref:membrane dipeptidase n=1 Tax=Streptomyces sp. A5-4 TaxID=3384771 RepID=UPI003DAA079F
MSFELHDRAVVADTHNDLLMAVTDILHITGVVGVEHVGLGPDFIEEVIGDVTPPCCEKDYGFPWALPGIEGPRGLPLVTEALIRRGLPEDDVRRIIGGNVLDLFRKELGRPA